MIYKCHSQPPINHPGQKKTIRMINRIFNWLRAYEDVRRYIQGCLICQKSRIGKERIQGIIKTHPLRKIMTTVYMDFYMVTFHGKRIKLLTMIDQFSKWAEIVEVEEGTSPTSEWIIDKFLEDWVFRFGFPEFLITDNKTNLCSRTIKRLMAILKISKIETTLYHPQENAVIETFHRILNRGLKNFYYTPVEIKEALRNIMFGYRVMIHFLTRNSPFYLLYGFDPTLTPDIDWRFAENLDEFSRLKYIRLIRLEVQLKAQMILAM